MNRAWEDERTAELYERFTRDFSMYDETSRDLVRLARVAEADSILDLACGTGATTRAVLDVATADAKVVALDGSKAMLDIARRRLHDGRIRWVHADATTLADHIEAADAIVCNSAVWQTDMARVFEAAARVLLPDGRFAFNIGRQFIMLPFTPDETSRSRPSLSDYVKAVATLEYDYVAPFARHRGRLLSQEVVEEMLGDARLRLDHFEVVEYESTTARDCAWLKIPIFANNLLDGMPYDQQLDVIEKAYARVDPTETHKSRWACFVASRS